MPLHPDKRERKPEGATHGGIDYAEMETLGLDPDKIIDFSVCTNPFMPPPGIKKILAGSRIDRYPDSRCTELKQRLAGKTGISTSNILVGSGTTELIRLVAAAFFRKDDLVLLAEPTYGDYEIAVKAAGARSLKYHAREENNFSIETRAVAALIRRRRPKAAIICNPNNPTGQYLSRQEVETIMHALGDGLLVLDEAYVSFIEDSWNSMELFSTGNIIILRSMTKDYNIPGLRLGYAVADQEKIDVLLPMVPPWNVNGIAQKAGVYLLKKENLLKDSLHRVREAKEYLSGAMSRLGLRVLHSDAHYFLVKVGNARAFRLSLLKSGLMVRDCASFGLPEYIRVSARSLPECDELIKAMKNIE